MKIVLQNLTKIFPSRNKKSGEEVVAVSDFSFEIPDGKLIGLLGPSGCGKSTTLYMISGLQKPTSGKIFFGEDDVTELSTEKRGIGLVFQNFNLFPHMTVLRNVTEAQRCVLGRGKEQAEAYARELLKKVGLSEREGFYPCQLSGGQQQRVAIARALALDPEILCFDEPTSALDPLLTQEVLAVIRALTEEKRTMLVVTHEMAFAREVASRVIYMENGLVAAQGAPDEVFSDERVRKFAGN